MVVMLYYQVYRTKHVCTEKNLMMMAVIIRIIHKIINYYKDMNKVLICEVGMFSLYSEKKTTLANSLRGFSFV